MDAIDINGKLYYGVRNEDELAEASKFFGMARRVWDRPREYPCLVTFDNSSDRMFVEFFYAEDAVELRDKMNLLLGE